MREIYLSLTNHPCTCDIARAASGLHDRGDELLKFDVIERTLADLGHADVTFTSSEYDFCKSLGQLHLSITVKEGKLFHFSIVSHRLSMWLSYGHIHL